ncbi:hypothetical protein BBK82_34445 [Lentzea guizhouensis]|uniref:Transcription regulator HTH AraC- type ligand binding domain-containing protein n=1 Tax=Lentzea guizhouensis TaxID=1586287 RepID=A0A1B2HRP2_9PSEU|nr:hypothetical protein [Lentzea guizhouensis]ANZ40368.1 hypothetical protein BBK82_34445 [Lentzea guizhouensis]
MATTSALTGGVPPRRFEFSTTDPDQAQDFISQMYRAQPPRDGRLDRASPVSVSQVSAGGLSHVDITMPPDLTLHLDGTDDLSVTTLVTGGVHAELGKHTERYRAGDVCLGTFPRGDYVVRCVDFRARILTVPAAAVAQVTGSMPDRPLPALRFGSLRPPPGAASRDLLPTRRRARSSMRRPCWQRRQEAAC